MTLRDKWTPWLGPAADTITDEQLQQLDQAADAIAARWPGPDDEDTRREALSGAMQVIVGDDTIEGLAEERHRARRSAQEAMDRLAGAMIAQPAAEEQLAARTGLPRDTVRRALGRPVTSSRRRAREAST